MWYQPGFGALQKQFEVIIVLGNVRHDHLNLRRYITYVILYNNRIDILFMMFAEYSQKKFYWKNNSKISLRNSSEHTPYAI